LAETSKNLRRSIDFNSLRSDFLGIPFSLLIRFVLARGVSHHLAFQAGDDEQHDGNEEDEEFADIPQTGVSGRATEDGQLSNDNIGYENGEQQHCR